MDKYRGGDKSLARPGRKQADVSVQNGVNFLRRPRKSWKSWENAGEYRGADKSLARPGRKQADVSVQDGVNFVRLPRKSLKSWENAGEYRVLISP